jgi:hypothetical protein
MGGIKRREPAVNNGGVFQVCDICRQIFIDEMSDYHVCHKISVTEVALP